MANKVIIIAGNIGAGKSTLIKYIKEKSSHECIHEFIDSSWRDLFYSNRKRYTGPFEMSCLMGRKARYVTSKKGDKIVFFDRGLIEGREIFVQNSFDEGYLSFEELENYDKGLKQTLDELGRNKEDAKHWVESLIVYLKTTPDVCFERQSQRNSKEDITGGELIPLEYFQRIHEYYEYFIKNIDKVYKKWGLPLKPKVLVIDASQNMVTDNTYLDKIYQKILGEINN